MTTKYTPSNSVLKDTPRSPLRGTKGGGARLRLTGNKIQDAQRESKNKFKRL